jgi:hypothetical protein
MLNIGANSIMQPTGIAALFASVTTATLDWTPAPASAARTGGLASFTGTSIAGRVTAFFGGALTGTSYVGAQDPNGAKWWQGWTSYAQN